MHAPVVHSRNAKIEQLKRATQNTFHPGILAHTRVCAEFRMRASCLLLPKGSPNTLIFLLLFVVIFQSLDFTFTFMSTTY